MNPETPAVDAAEDISMEEVLGPPRTWKGRILSAIWPVYRSIQRFFEPKVLFRGVRRNVSDFLPDGSISYGTFTREETERAAALAKPFNDVYNDVNDEISQSMFAKWMDKEGFIFAVYDDFGSTVIDIVHEKDLAGFTVK